VTQIASVDLIAIDGTGKRSFVAFRIGAPEQLSSDEWQCGVSLEGLHDELGSIHGADSLQALSLAMGLASTLLREFVARGGRLVYKPESRETVDEIDWPLESYFGTLGTHPLPPNTR
jgi:hypothetical protein